METVETIQRVIPFLLIGLNGYVCWRKPSLLFNVFLAFLVIGVLAEMGMVFVEHELNRRDWAWEIRNIYGFFDTVILMWIAVRYGNYKNSIRKARLFASVVGGVWIVFFVAPLFQCFGFSNWGYGEHGKRRFIIGHGIRAINASGGNRSTPCEPY